MTLTVKDKSQLLIPPSPQRQAGFKSGDRLELKVSRGVITIAAKADTVDDYTPAQRRVIDAQLAESDKDVKAGRVHGPFTVSQSTSFLRTELKARAKKQTSR